MIETIIVVVLVVGALYFAARSLTRSRKGLDGAGCGGGCPGCSHAELCEPEGAKHDREQTAEPRRSEAD